MIWQSVPLMTAIDLAIIGVSLYAIRAFLRQRRRFVASQALMGLGLIVGGLSVIALFFFLDLLTMFVFPLFMPIARAMAAMNDLHLNYSWIVLLLSTGAIGIGFARTGSQVFDLIHTLRHTETRLQGEIDARRDADRQLRESESRLRSVFDSAPLSMHLKDTEGRYLMVNKWNQAWMGRAEEEYLGRTVHDFFPPDLAERLTSSDREAIELRTPVSFDAEFENRSGATEIHHVVKFPVFGEGGSVVAVGGMAIDITDQKRLEEQLHQSQKMEMVGQLTGGVAHDFNNLLTVVLGNLELLSDRVEGDDTALSYLDRAASNARKGAELVHRLLAFSRKQALMPQVIEPTGLIAGVHDLLRRTLGETIEIEVSLADDLWHCEADPAQLESAVLNLAINARDAMPDGGMLTIECANVTLDDAYVAAQVEVTPGDYVMIAVTDTGTGMPRKVADQVFEPFFTTKRGGEGSGLGLSMVYGFVKQSGGHVTIYSEEGVGTTVRLYLRRSDKESGAARREFSEVEPNARGETILVVEDDGDVRTLTVALLRNLGYEILEAADGESALTVLDRTPRVNMLLTDVVLPGAMNGPVLAKEVERRSPGVAVLYTSGYTDNAIVHQGRLDEGVELLSKPFSKGDLARKVRSVLDARAA